MHWILTVSDSFSLSKVIRRSEWLIYPPFRISGNYRRLHRVERLESGHTVEVMITQTSTGLMLQTDTRLSGKETEEVSQKVWRVLRIGENFQTFISLARKTPALASISRLGAQLLRGTTLFEDIAKSLLLTWRTTSEHVQPIAWVVDHFGDPLPSNPTLHAFPTPRQVLQERALQERMLSPALAKQLTQIAEIFRTQKDQIAGLDLQLPLDHFEAEFQQIFNLDEHTTALVMLYLGRYDYIPTNPKARQQVRNYLHADTDVRPDQVRTFFAPWQPWGGLAYWLWDWSTTPTGDPFESEVQYGELESQHRPS